MVLQTVLSPYDDRLMASWGQMSVLAHQSGYPQYKTIIKWKHKKMLLIILFPLIEKIGLCNLQFHKIIISVCSAMSSSILFPTNEYATSSKSSEEIQKLIIPNNNSIQDTLLFIMSKGLSSQLPYLYRHMHLAHKITLSFICAKASAQEVENQILIANSLKNLLQEKGPQLMIEQIEKIFQTALQCLNNLYSPANEEMIYVLQETIRFHSNNKKLIKRLEEVSLDLGRPTQPIISKVTSGRFISILAKYIGRMIKGDMIDILKRIFSDNEIEAKKVWLSQIFPKLLQNLDLQFIELHLQEKIYESVWDENEQICMLALEVILKNVHKFSLQEQSSRIVKLFIDSLTSKKQKVSLLSSQMMGESYQKLLNIILKNETNCIKFWKSLIQISQSKNQRIVNNLVYNLPGILMISSPIYKVDPICEVYIELFYQPLSNKALLSSYFHEIAKMFPSKSNDLKEVVYWMFNELFQQEDPYEQAIKILIKILQYLYDCRHIYICQSDEMTIEDNQQKNARYFQSFFCEYLLKFLNLLINKKNVKWLNIIYNSIKECSELFSPDFIQQHLMPKLYLCLRNKTSNIQTVVETVLMLISRDGNSTLINTYVSKINVELSRSTKGYQRETALLFFYYATYYFSIDLFQEYRLGQKYLFFNYDKNFKVKASFIKYMPRMIYFFNRQEKIEYAIIIGRLTKDIDPEIQILLEQTNFIESLTVKNTISEESRKLKEKEKEKTTNLTLKKQQIQNRRSSKELKKQDILKKRIQTSSKPKAKLLIKQMPKKKIGPMLIKTASNLNFRKNS